MAHRSSHKPQPPLPFLLGEAEDEREEESTDPDGGKQAPLPGPVSLAGSRLGNYRLVSRLGQGGMSEVWMADALSGTRAGKTLALKRLLPVLRADPATAERFRAEARLGALLDHPNLAGGYALQETASELIIARELVPGETLGQLAVAARRAGERLSVAATLHAVQGLLAGLAYLHAGGGPGRFGPTLHGDVNPENVVAGPEGALKLIDLGIAAPLGVDGAAAGDGALRGTAAYMAPEQVKGRALTVRADLFSAGIVLWELLANRPLFAAQSEFETLRRVREMPAPPLRAVWREAPTVLERLCVRALAKEPEHRFASAAEMAEALHQAALREGIAAGPEALAAAVKRHAPHAVHGDLTP